MKKKTLVCVIATVLVLSSLAFTVSPAMAKVYRWRMPAFVPGAGDTYEEFMKVFCEDAKKASDGRLVITPYGAGEIVPVLEMWESVSKGVIEMAWTYGAYSTGKTPMAAISAGLPFTARSMLEASGILLDAGIEDLVRKDYSNHNIHLLTTFPVHETVTCTKFPVNSLADFKGKKLRAGGLQAEVMAAVGIPTAFFPVPEVYGALDTGVVDGVIMGGIPAARLFSFYEVVKYIVTTPIDVACEEILINQDAWNKLPDDLQHILKMCGARQAYKRAWWTNSKVLTDLAWMKKKWNIKTTTLPAEDEEKLASEAMKVYEKMAEKSPEFKEALKQIRSYLE